MQPLIILSPVVLDGGVTLMSVMQCRVRNCCREQCRQSVRGRRVGFDENFVYILEFFVVDVDEVSIPFDGGVIGSDVHEGGDGTEFADLIEENDDNCFWEFVEDGCADCCDGHQEVFVKNFSVDDVFLRCGGGRHDR